MSVFKIAFFLILSVAIPFFFGYMAHALKSWTTRIESEDQPPTPPTTPAPETPLPDTLEAPKAA